MIKRIKSGVYYNYNTHRFTSKSAWKRSKTIARKKLEVIKKKGTVDFKLQDVKPDERMGYIIKPSTLPKPVRKYLRKSIKDIRKVDKVWGLKISIKSGKRRTVSKKLLFNEKKYEYDNSGVELILDNVIDRMQQQWQLPSKLQSTLSIKPVIDLPKDRRLKK